MSSTNNKNKQSDMNGLFPPSGHNIPVCGPGTRIGQFKIEREIGRGGMGVVYLAHDSKLDRKVAIKSIPSALADDDEVKARFGREAKLLASLDHPDIATIHDFIEGDKDSEYLVLEYIPGETLAQRIAQGPIPLRETLSIGRRIAAAFASAHERGIVHRDLKPSNIKITPEGRVKVLDFGIAKAAVGDFPDTHPSVTKDGHIVGTPAYMSPEQVRGRTTDQRADIWSFGCILYEMLVGRVPFEGETASDKMSAVLEREPDLNALPQETPPNITLLIRRCLEKEPTRRLQHIGDAALEISETLNLPAVVPPLTASATVVARSVSRGRSVVVKAAVFVLAVVAIALITRSWFRPSSKGSSNTVRLTVPLDPTGNTFLIYRGKTPLLLSPDGKSLVLYMAKQGTPSLCIRPMDSYEAKPISGTENAYDPFFSPDGQWLAFFTKDESNTYSLWKTEIGEGGNRMLLTKNKNPFAGGSWGKKDAIVFCEEDEDANLCILHRISTRGGASEVVAKIENEGDPYAYPRILPDDKTVICGIWGTTSLVSLDTGESTPLMYSTKTVQYSPTGHLLFVRDGGFFAVPFDEGTLEKSGPEVLIEKAIAWNDFFYRPYFSISDDGTLAYVPAFSERSSLVWVDREGNPKPVEGAPYGNYEHLRLSPDETRIALGILENNQRQVWEYDLDRTTPTQLTFEPGLVISMCWMPSHEDRVSFSLVQNGAGWKPQLFSVSTNGGKPEPLLPVNMNVSRCLESWSPDGRYMTYIEGISREVSSWIVPFGEDGKPGEPILFADPNDGACPMMLRPPDGDSIAFVSSKTGKTEVYIREFRPDGQDKAWTKKVSIDGGTEPCWSRDGRKLFYRSASGMMEVDISSKSNGTIEVGKSQRLFDDTPYKKFCGLTNYDVTSDGCFLMIRKDPPKQINVVLNWAKELERLAPKP